MCKMFYAHYSFVSFQFLPKPVLQTEKSKVPEAKGKHAQGQVSNATLTELNAFFLSSNLTLPPQRPHDVKLKTTQGMLQWKDLATVRRAATKLIFIQHFL